jgi:hypothetical protein
MILMNNQSNGNIQSKSSILTRRDRTVVKKKKSAGKALLLGIAGLAILFFLSMGNSSCNVYKFRDIAIPDSIKTIKVNFIENRAPYVNPLLSPRLTDRLKQKIVTQTKLSQTNNDNADWDVKGYISNYTSSTSGISQQQVATNRLTVTVHISVNDQKANKTQEYDVSRNFEYSASKSLTQAEQELADEIIRGLTDDIFNRIFSNW